MPVDVKGGSWAHSLTSAGYQARKFHYYAKGERKPVCYGDVRKASAKGVLPPPTDRQCVMCQRFLKEHPEGVRRNNQ